DRPDGYPIGFNAIGFLAGDAPRHAEDPLPSKGRLPNPKRVHEIFLNDSAASLLGAKVGDTVHYSLYKFDELFYNNGELNPDAEFTPVWFKVVGTGTSLDDLLANENQSTEEGVLTPAFTKQYLERASFQIGGVFLHNGARDIPRFTAALNHELGDERVQLQTLVVRERQFHDVTVPYTTALWLFG